tara:strand:+ start:1526 stop:1951 length:426 start_codon:yes stop_codon:yes gene_type:complete
MYQLIYSSRAIPSFTIDDLTYLTEQARQKNAQADITGLLLFYNHYFFQALEGDKTTLETLYLKIATDKRHTDIMLLEMKPLAERAFSHWRLGIANFPSQLPTITPQDFFTKNLQFTLNDKEHIEPLIASFAHGLNQVYVRA